MIKFKSETPENMSLELGPNDILFIYEALHNIRQNPQINDLQHEAILRMRAEITKVVTPYIEKEDESKEKE